MLAQIEMNLNEILLQLEKSGGILALVIPVLIQALKRVPLFVKLHNEGYPVYELLAIVLGIGGAFTLGLPNAAATGLLTAMAACKGFDWVKAKTKPSIPTQ